MKNTTDNLRAVACIRFVRFWHRAWALYHSFENHAACRRGDLSGALTHAEKELKHMAKMPPLCKPNADLCHGKQPKTFNP